MWALAHAGKHEDIWRASGSTKLPGYQKFCHDGAGQDHAPQRHQGSKLLWDGQGCGELETCTAAA